MCRPSYHEQIDAFGPCPVDDGVQLDIEMSPHAVGNGLGDPGGISKKGLVHNEGSHGTSLLLVPGRQAPSSSYPNFKLPRRGAPTWVEGPSTKLAISC